MPQFFFKSCFIFAFVLSLAACRKNSRAERIANDEIIVNIGGNVRTLHAGLVSDTISARAVQAVMAGLTRLDEKGNPQPDLAESWTVSPDGKVYDFKLRPSKWSNGEPVTADDFAFAFTQRILKPEFAAEYGYMLFYLEGAKDYFDGKTTDPKSVGIEAVAPDHLRLRLTSPLPFFPSVVSLHVFFPTCRKTDEANPNWYLRAETYVSNGPFKLLEYSPGGKIECEKNEDYWNAANVAMKRLSFRQIETESTERIAFENGELDVTYSAPRPDLVELAKTGLLHQVPQIGTYYLNFNMKHPQLADKRVREALTLAIDRAAITKNVSRAGEKVALRFVPPELWPDGTGKEFFKDADFERAKQLMAEAGFPDGKGFPKLRYVYNTLELHEAIGQVVQESWRKHLGVEIELINQEFKVLQETRNAGQYDIARNAWVADFGDPVNFLEIYITESGNNVSQWGDPAYDALIEQSRNEVDPIKRMEILRQAEDYFMNLFVVMPVYHYAQPYLCAAEVDGYYVNPMFQVDFSRIRWKK